MISKIFLLLLPSLALATIQIHLAGDYGEGDPQLDVYYNGISIDIISNKDMKTFGLNNNAIVNAVNKYFHRRPSHFYLKSPTAPFGDLYKRYGFDQVQRTLRPISAKVIAVNSQPTIVLNEEFENNSSNTASFNVAISQEVTDTVSSRWFKKQETFFDAKAEYSFNVGFSKGGASMEFKYDAVWGEDQEKSSTVTVGATSALQILLQPGQAVLASLFATRSTVKIEVQYDATLSGALAAHYENRFRGHYFWAMDINAVCEAGGLNNTAVAREEITLNYFWNGKVSVRDRSTHKKVMVEVHY